MGKKHLRIITKVHFGFYIRTELFYELNKINQLYVLKEKILVLLKTLSR